jgi:3',5'-nucleoside bisphosphate phosphatase
MTRIAADLHVHTSLSPCASADMTPPRIASEAIRRGLAMIAVCDHNTAAGVRGVMEAARAEGPSVIAGIEITTREEAHVLGWFPSAEAAEAAAGFLEVDASLASAATQCTLSQTVELIHRHGGLAVAAHVDRRSFSVPGQLGFIPPDVPFDGLEISAAGAARGRASGFSALGLPLLSSSDAHFLEDLGTGVTILEVEEPGFDELARAMRRLEGRGCVIA